MEGDWTHGEQPDTSGPRCHQNDSESLAAITVIGHLIIIIIVIIQTLHVKSATTSRADCGFCFKAEPPDSAEGFAPGLTLLDESNRI